MKTTRLFSANSLLISVAGIYSIILLLGGYGIGFSLATTPLEVWIFISGALCVWLAVLAHAGNWPVGIVNVILWTVLFLQTHLYANAVLQIVYIITGFLGWYWWVKRKKGVQA